MAFSFSIFLRISIIILLLLVLSVSTSHAGQNEKVTDAQLHEICSKQEDPSFCLEALKSDPRTAHANMHGLVKISLDLARSKIKENKVKVKNIAKDATDPEVKNRCKFCLESYEGAIGDLEDARKALKSKDYISIGVRADSCGTYIDDCWNGEVTQPEKPFLPDDNNKALQLCMIMGVTARSIKI